MQKDIKFSFWQSIYFTLLMSALAINSCSANPPDVVKQVGVKINSELENVFPIPSTHSFQMGDTITVRAIVNSPYFFNGWRKGLSGNQNPQTFVVSKPITISFDYTTGLNFQLSLENSEYTDTTTFEFDVMIRTFTESFELTAYQVALQYNGQWRDGQSLNFSYIAGSSELTNIPQFAIRWDTTVSPRFTFGSGPGSDEISTLPKRIGRFKITIPVSFVFGIPVGLNFFFDLPVNTIITGEGISDINEFGIFKGLPETHRAKIIFE